MNPEMKLQEITTYNSPTIFFILEGKARKTIFERDLRILNADDAIEELLKKKKGGGEPKPISFHSLCIILKISKANRNIVG